MPDCRAVFIWAMDKTSPSDVNLLRQHVIMAQTCGWSIKILGHPSLVVSEPLFIPYFFGEPNNPNMPGIFDHSQTVPPGFLSGEYDRAWIVIFDHSQTISGDFEFSFLDENEEYKYPFSDLCYNLNTECKPRDMCLVIMGRQSGKALLPLSPIIESPDGDRIIITSMSQLENKPDKFNLAAQLNCNFIWRDAFIKERNRLQGYQTPQILPP